MAIVFNKPDSAVKDLNHRWFEPYIHVVIGESDSVPKKPNPAVFDLVLNQLHANPENAVYVGDSEADVQTAKNAGIQFVGVTWGFKFL